MFFPTASRLLVRQPRLIPALRALGHVSTRPALRIAAPRIVAPSSRNFLSFLKRSAPPAAVPAPAARTGSEYPERLLVYYAGKRTVYLGTMKLYTVLLFSYCSLVVAPSLIGVDNSEVISSLGLAVDLELPGWVLPASVVLGSLVPLVLMQYLSWVLPVAAAAPSC